MISKKNIRYEGLLYSINEQNATVALQNVRSFGTEGRDTNDPETEFVAATEMVHPFLLFRGQDIKDLHVHENQDAPTATTKETTAAGAAASSKEPPAAAPKPSEAPPAPKPPAGKGQQQPKPPQQQQQQQKSGGNNNNRRPRNKPNAAVGTGASLLNRKARGVVDDHGPQDAKTDFDFQRRNDQFAKEAAEDEEAGDEPVDAVGVGSYEKDDFFDSISCDAIDKQSGVDNRLRGSQERHLNTETFGAVALNNSRRRGGRGRGRGGRGRGGRGGRGGGGRGGNRRSYNWNNRSGNNNSSSSPGGQQSRYSSTEAA